MDDEQYSTLNGEQVKAFKSMKRALEKCKAANVKFYTVLETIYFVNGDEIDEIWEPEIGSHGGVEVSQCIDLHSHTLADNGFVGFADDTHLARFK